MADIRIKNFVNEALASNTSLTNAWFAVDKESPDRTEKMNATEMFKLDETKVPFIGQNYVIVNAKGTSEENYSALLASLTLVNSLTPNGLALSAINRATLYLLNGNYVTASSVVALAPSKFVDIIGIGNKESIIIGSNSSQPVIKLANDNNNVFKNFTIINAGAGESFGWNTGQFDYSRMDNLIISSKFTENTSFNGIYTNLECTVDEVLNGAFGGGSKVLNCKFKNKSCGYSATGDVYIPNTCEIINNDADGFYCFGATENGGQVDIQGIVFDNNTTGGFSFGYSDTGIVNISNAYLKGNGKKTPAESCFGSSTGLVTVSGSILEDNEATLYSFGDSSSNTRIIKCKRTGNYGTHAGFIEQCDFIGDLVIRAGATVRRCDIDQGKIDATIPINAKIYLNSLDQVFSVNITNLIGTPYNVVDNNI